MRLLAVNAGSASVRFAVYHAGTALTLLGEAQLDDAGATGADDVAALLQRCGRVDAAVHRVVHGGARFSAPVRIDAHVEAEIERLSVLAPLHNPLALHWIRACRARLGAQLPQVAVFDTAWYAALPARARHYALPRALCAEHGLYRYGFHGLAHAAMWRRWCELQPGRDVERARVISMQLGGGCSITAVHGGRAVDTSMGFSPLEGLVMATRSGDLDPGLLLYLQRAAGHTPAQLEALLNRESGLLGLSGRSGDMRALLAADDDDARAAIEVYCYRARKYVGACLAALGGADALLIGGGVGEHAPPVRARMLEGLEALGIALDAQRNAAAVGGEARISVADSVIAVWVLPVNEAAVLARAAMEVLAPAPAQGE